MSKRGLGDRVRDAEAASEVDPWSGEGDGGPAPTTSDTRTDRFPLIRRLKKLEELWGLAASAAAKIRNNRKGVDSRLKTIETAIEDAE